MKRTSAARTDSVRPMTLADWADLDEDEPGELVDGVLEDEEMPTVLHELIVTWLVATLVKVARRRRGVVLGSETKIAVGPRRGRKPDISVFLPPHLPALTDALVRVAPYLAVEILSPRPRDARRDRVDKLRDYARAGVANYWIIDPVLRTVEAYELDRVRSRYACVISATAGRIRVPCLGATPLDLDAMWREATVLQPVKRRRR